MVKLFISLFKRKKKVSVSTPKSGLERTAMFNPLTALLPFASSIEKKSYRCSLPGLAGLAQPNNLKGQKVIVGKRPLTALTNRPNGFDSG